MGVRDVFNIEPQQQQRVTNSFVLFVLEKDVEMFCLKTKPVLEMSWLTKITSYNEEQSFYVVDHNFEQTSM